MNTVRNNIQKNFTIAPNELINDEKLSDRARFLFIYMSSKPEEWTFYNYQLSKALGYSEDTLRKYIDQLILSGWISKINQGRISGKFTANTYILNPQPMVTLPYRKNTDTVKNRHRKTKTLSNTNIRNTRNKKNKDFNSLKKKTNQSISNGNRGASLK